MIKKKLLVMAALLIATSIFATACGDDDNDASSAPAQQTTGTFGQKTASNDKPQSKVDNKAQPKFEDLKVNHAIDFDGQQIPFVATYSIQKEFAKSWWFSDTESIDLSLKPTQSIPGVDIAVSGLYSDVSTASKWTQYNAIRQDSLNKSMNNTPDTAGYTIDTNNPYTTRFQVEPINLTTENAQTSAWLAGGFGSTFTVGNLDTKITKTKISEDDIRHTVYAARLRTVWTVILTKDGKHYERTITDNILIPYEHYKKATPK